MTRRFDPAEAQARECAAAALKGYDYALLQSQHAAPRLVKAFGLEQPAAVDLVAAERRRRAPK